MTDGVHLEMIERPCACGCSALAHTGPDGACLQCRACLGWVLPADEMAALIERELSEIVDFGGRAATVDTAMSENLLTILVRTEAQFDKTAGWDNEPALYIIKNQLSALGLHTTTLEPVPVPDDLWNLGPDKEKLIEHLARSVHSIPGARDALLRQKFAPGPFRFIGCAVVGEAWIRRMDGDFTRSASAHPELREDECRFIFAVDVDHRQYQVVRRRSDGEVMPSVTTAPYLLREAQAYASQTGAKMMLDMEGWPPLPAALRLLVDALSAGGQ